MGLNFYRFIRNVSESDCWISDFQCNSGIVKGVHRFLAIDSIDSTVGWSWFLEPFCFIEWLNDVICLSPKDRKDPKETLKLMEVKKKWKKTTVFIVFVKNAIGCSYINSQTEVIVYSFFGTSSAFFPWMHCNISN